MAVEFYTPLAKESIRFQSKLSAADIVEKVNTNGKFLPIFFTGKKTIVTSCCFVVNHSPFKTKQYTLQGKNLLHFDKEDKTFLTNSLSCKIISSLSLCPKSSSSC